MLGWICLGVAAILIGAWIALVGFDGTAAFSIATFLIGMLAGFGLHWTER